MGIDNLKAGIFGFMDPKKCEIVVDEDLNPIVERETILHEVMHACCHYTGIPVLQNDAENNTYTEETFIECIDSALLQVLMENPDLVSYLVSK